MKIRKIIIFSLLFIVIFIGFKFYCFKKYEASDNLELSNVKINGKMRINHNVLEDSEYITFENLKFKNIFEGYERLNEESNAYKMILKDENGQTNKAVFIGSEDEYVYIINNNAEYKYLSESIIKKENINDDLDFIKYMEKHNDDKVEFLMSIIRQKQIHSINEFKINMLPSIIYVKEIDGYFRGYIFKTNENITEVNLLKNNKKYYFTFFGDYTLDFINDFMNYVVIE